MAPEQIRVVVPDVGGGFGARIGIDRDTITLAWAARKIGRALRWTETRSENLVAMTQGRAQLQRIKIGGSRDGRILAYRIDVIQDAGAYQRVGGLLPFLTCLMAPGVYDIPDVQAGFRQAVTNTTPIGAYRGAGRPEATAAIERAVDLFAAEIGMDPAEVRRRNLVQPNAFPFTTPTGATYDVGDYSRALDLALDASGYTELRKEQARRREAGEMRQLGIGVSVYVEITNGVPGSEDASVEMLENGTARVRTGTSPHGQGHVTAWAMLVGERLGLPVDAVEVVHGDTDVVPRGVGTFGSRSLQVGGVSAHQAAGQVVDKARHLAAKLLEADPADVVLDKVGQRFHVAGTPAVSRSWTELGAEAGPGGPPGGADLHPAGAPVPV